MRPARDGSRLARSYAWVTAGLSPFIVVGLIAAAVAAWVLLPPLGGSSSAPLQDIVPADAPALVAQEQALERFGSTFGADTVIVQRAADGLPRETLETAARGALAANDKTLPRGLKGVLGAAPLPNVPLPGVKWNETGTAVLTYLFLSPDLNLLERDRAARRYHAQVLGDDPGVKTTVTGAGPARLAQFEVIEDKLPWVELATVLVILIIVAAYFRSFGAPLVTLITAAVAYVLAIRALAWTGDRLEATVPSEIEPVLVVLLLGLVTDYTIFFMSETRRRLLRGEPRLQAVRRATTRIAPIVFTAGILVAGGSASLLAGHMEFFRIFGPGLAVCALVVTLVCVTFVPAVLALVGPWIFGRRVREATPDTSPLEVLTGEHPIEPRNERWRARVSGVLGALRASRTQAAREGTRVSSAFGARMLATRPIALLLSVVTIGALVFAASGAREIDLAVSHIPSLPKDSEPRRAADDAARAFAAGVLAPTEIVLDRTGITDSRPELERLQTEIAGFPGVAAVLGPKQAAVEELEPVVLSEDGGAARLAVFLEDEPTGADAVNTLGDLRTAMPGLLERAGLPERTLVAYGGETALAEETVESIVDDLARVALATALVTLLLLAIFLRSIVAPILLLAGSVLAFAASFGLMALLLPHWLGGHDVVYYVPLVGAVLLVGLGSDYNVFIAGRIREEARRRRLGEAIAVAAPSASKAITVAGITLAATFALLAIVPLRPFRELAILMSVGVLVDALLVRPLLIPSLLAVAGRFAWWPSRPKVDTPGDAFLDAVARHADGDISDAARITRATFTTLAERIPARESRELADRLPDSVSEPFREEYDCEPFGYQEFLLRVAERAQESLPAAEQDAVAVVAALREALPETELDYVRAALSDDYRGLFGTAAAPPVGAPEPVAG